ncbi:MAG: hypothetical protein ACI87E_004373, partial [Mariniblastus sp.]
MDTSHQSPVVVLFRSAGKMSILTPRLTFNYFETTKRDNEARQRSETTKRENEARK